MAWLPVSISILSFALSCIALWHTMSARAHVQAEVERIFTMPIDSSRSVPERDAVVIYNTGRVPAIILKVGAINEEGMSTSPGTMPQAGGESVPFPELPVSLPPQGALRVSFSAHLIDPDSAYTRGFSIVYLKPRGRRPARRSTLTVKATRRRADTVTVQV